MSYVTLGARGPVTGLADMTGLNSGNWTVAFTPAILNVNVPQFEVYKMIVAGAPNTTFRVYIDGQQWDVGIYGTQNSWDPVQPLIVRPGQYLYFMYSDAISDANPPVVTVWLRYDPLLNNLPAQLVQGLT
jgi:hypothetical protein